MVNLINVFPLLTQAVNAVKSHVKWHDTIDEKRRILMAMLQIWMAVGCGSAAHACLGHVGDVEGRLQVASVVQVLSDDVL